MAKPEPESHPAQEIPSSPDGTRFINRELSWLAFNGRVLEEALDSRNPLLERLRFLTIFHTNLDEFFMIRVSGVKQQIAAGVEVLSIDGLSPRQNLARIEEILAESMAEAQSCLVDELLPALESEGIQIVALDDLGEEERAHWDAWYQEKVHPVLTPLAVSHTHPFPFISNLSLNLAVLVTSPVTHETRMARVKVPPYLPRLIRLESELDQARFLLLEELIGANLRTLFPGMRVGRPWLFRVIRDADFDIRDDEANDLLVAIEERLRHRRFGAPVRCAIQAGAPKLIRQSIESGLELRPGEAVEVHGLLGPSELVTLCRLDRPELKFRPFVPATREGLISEVFETIRQGDQLLHHPFDSFDPVVEFIRAAAKDPRVRAIKHTLYRIGGAESPIVAALLEAAENGKQVAVLVELKARFDEANNIVWARRLERAGVHVVYGVQGLKTHAKMALVVREEGGKHLRRYAHIGTGNYNPITARVYTDLGLLTARRKICADVADVFNRLTGFSQPAAYRRLLVAPTHMKQRLLDLVAFEAKEAALGKPAAIIAKCNAITETELMEALYDASGQGVEIDLLVRGICCLVPGQPNLSENIRVRSVVGRFLEHSRVYWFHHGGKPKVYIGSADLMTRNLDRRVEVLVPIESQALKSWLRDHYLQRYLDDTVRTRTMGPHGDYRRNVEDTLDVHSAFLSDLES